jgi:hypothetical protein
LRHPASDFRPLQLAIIGSPDFLKGVKVPLLPQQFDELSFNALQPTTPTGK